LRAAAGLADSADGLSASGCGGSEAVLVSFAFVLAAWGELGAGIAGGVASESSPKVNGIVGWSPLFSDFFWGLAAAAVGSAGASLKAEGGGIGEFGGMPVLSAPTASTVRPSVGVASVAGFDVVWAARWWVGMCR